MLNDASYLLGCYCLPGATLQDEISLRFQSIAHSMSCGRPQ